MPKSAGPKSVRPKSDVAKSGKRESGKSKSETAKLKSQLRAARDRQSASAEILRTIASSPDDAGRSLQQIAETSARLFGASSVAIQLAKDGEWGEAYRFGHSAQRIRAAVPLATICVGGRNMPGMVIGQNRQIHIPDLDHLDPSMADWPGLPYAREAGSRVMAGTPLRRERKAIGALIVHRDRPEPFTAEELALQQSFADQAVIAIENARLFNEVQVKTRDLSESLQQQTATAEVLKVISRSAFDLQMVLNTLVESATTLCEADRGILFRREDELYKSAAHYGYSREFQEYHESHPIAPGRGTAVGRAALEGKAVNIPDVLADPEYTFLEAQKLGRYRANLVVPLLREGSPVGAFSLTRAEPRPFTEKQIELVETFADQAVIAIENARLFNETKEALERQTATADILKVIASSPSDVQPVFEAIAERSNRLVGGHSTAVYRFVNEAVELAAFTRVSPEADEVLQRAFPRALGDYPLFQLVRGGDVIQFPDTESDLGVTAEIQSIARARGFRSYLLVPLASADGPIGLISVTRKETGSFADHHVQLLRTFADQAVIAIQNVRLFEEVQARTRDLSESLQQLTATSEVLKVISSSPGELEPVFRAMLENAIRICDAKFGNLFLIDGDKARWEAGVGTPPKLAQYLTQSRSFRPTPGGYLDRVMRTKQTSHTADYTAEADIGAGARLGGARSTVCVPMVKDDALVGAILIYRTEVRPFTDKQIDLLKNFAAQAVIAIENTRLLTELRESLQQQTATADVLKVISASPGDMKPVFESILSNAMRICEAKFGHLLLYDGESFHATHLHDVPSSYREYWEQHGPIRPSGNTGLARLARSKQVTHIPDLKADSAYAEREPLRVVTVEQAGARSFLAVPMLNENKLIGAVVIYRKEVRPFTEKQIELLKNFAAQAVIAIENTRLLSELRELLQQQTATADVLKVISRSTFDLQTVLQTLVESAARLCDAEKATITRQKDGVLFRGEFYGFSDEFMDYVRNVPVVPDRGSATARALLEGVVVHIPDVQADPDYTFNEAQRLGDFRTIMGVPMLREGKAVGVIVMTRSEVRPFTDKQIELATTFADQAAIAIENVRLFEQVQQRTRELSISLDDLRTAQDRLVQTEKLASLGQLTAGIAHEIKNPLNFVNNFSALSAELVGEMKDALSDIDLDRNKRQELDAIAQMLNDNLEKIVLHGKRADSIVKNMLQHSREGSGEHRPADINAIVEESMNLAYHGARAEKAGFNITLERNLDPAAGMADVYPQEITRVLLNLISNGFYAATKRKAEAGDGFEPRLSATTKNLGDKVEIHIRDNGTGIPEEVKEKIFNPFFTTKPSGEGTGLGLSMSHDIIVKQHGGSIDVETKPGQFTEFRIVLSRTSRT